MDDLTATALHSMICEQFEACYAQEDAMNEIEDRLFQGCSEEDSRDEVYSRMILNSMIIAADISVKVIVEILLNSGVIAPMDEKRLRKMILSPVNATQEK